MPSTLAPATGSQVQSGRGYLIDQSHPPLFFAAVLGIGEPLARHLGDLEQSGRDASPIVVESRTRLAVINLYEPEPITIQVVQQDDPSERMTEILGAGVGIGVLSEIRRTARILNLLLTPLTDPFRRRLAAERMTVVQAFRLLPGGPTEKQSRWSQILRAMQSKYRREASLLRQLL